MKVEGLKIEGKMLSHMAFDTAHIMKHELTIIAPGNLIKFQFLIGTIKSMCNGI